MHSVAVKVACVPQDKQTCCTTSMCLVAEVGESSGPSFGMSNDKADLHSCLSHDVSGDTSGVDQSKWHTDDGLTEAVLSVHTCGCMSNDVPATSDEVQNIIEQQTKTPSICSGPNIMTATIGDTLQADSIALCLGSVITECTSGGTNDTVPAYSKIEDAACYQSAGQTAVVHDCYLVTVGDYCDTECKGCCNYIDPDVCQ